LNLMMKPSTIFDKYGTEEEEEEQEEEEQEE
jgi:hypothetical protein